MTDLTLAIATVKDAAETFHAEFDRIVARDIATLEKQHKVLIDTADKLRQRVEALSGEEEHPTEAQLSAIQDTTGEILSKIKARYVGILEYEAVAHDAAYQDLFNDKPINPVRDGANILIKDKLSDIMFAAKALIQDTGNYLEQFYGGDDEE